MVLQKKSETHLESSMWNNFISVFVASLLVCLPVTVKAQDSESPTPLLPDLTGKVTSLNQGQQAPYSGVLLDPEATAKILAERKFLGLQCDLKLDLDIKKLTAEHELELGLLQTKFDSLQVNKDKV